MSVEQILQLLAKGLAESLYMTFAAGFFAYLFGLPLGILLAVSSPGGLRPKPTFYRVLGLMINLLRSAPFLILLVAIIPLTRAIVGSSIGSTATIVPLFVASTPFIARLVEQSLREVSPGILEAGASMGASDRQLVLRFMIPEALPSLISGATIAMTTILSYSALAGFVGGGGLGSIAINYGYYRYKADVMIWTLLLLLILVQIMQWIGNALARAADHRL